ncbi:hypothetical protein DXV75_08390 [Alteromonas aestuariivivens]|uniref:Galactose oxidase n=1 Tax=Alteromonas aestuariivivens TaxID=1938339 RepID=A0A3D8M8S8_9ALTE|nr:hypothetical protein [Alteromonas aestuariivivens]RDV26088.1 hypothetical protein DXV75_08390 [Alteromonas aestuariivivens]
MVRAFCLLLTWVISASFAADIFERYHWVLGPALPQPVQEIYPALLGGSIVVAGGLKSTEDGGIQVLDSVLTLAPGAGQWEQMAAPIIPEVP